MRGGEWCCATALARDGVPCGLSPMALFMCRQWHWGRRNEGVQRGFEQQQLVDVYESPEYACAVPHERAVHAAAFVLRGSGSLLSWGVGAKPSVLIRSRALHVTGVGVFVEYLLPTRPLLRLASAVVGAEDFGLGDVPQRCWCPRARAARTMCQASARGRATHALPEHVFVCIVPAPHLRCGPGGGGFRTEGMRPAKPPAGRRVFVNHSFHAPCACPPGTSALLSCCGGTRYPPPPRAATTKTLPCTQVCVVAPQDTDRPPGPLCPRIQIPPIGPIGPILRHKCEAVQRARILRVSVAVFPPLPRRRYDCSVLTGPHAFVDDTARHRSRGHAS